MEQRKRDAIILHLPLLLLLLGFTCLIFLSSGCSASPETEEASMLNIATQGIVAGKLPEAAEEELLRGRLDIESHDYTPSANPRHDPKPPRRG